MPLLDTPRELVIVSSRYIGCPYGLVWQRIDDIEWTIFGTYQELSQMCEEMEQANVDQVHRS